MTTDWRSDVNTKEGKKHFKVALRAGLKRSALKRNFRQDSLFWCFLWVFFGPSPVQEIGAKYVKYTKYAFRISLCSSEQQDG